MVLRKNRLSSLWACLTGLVLGAVQAPQAQTYQVSAPNGLTALATNLAGPGVHRVQFAPGGYDTPGQLSLSASSADSIIFERSAPSASVVQVSNRLLRIEGLTATTVVIRGLAFKLNHATQAELVNGRASANQRLRIDSCIILADSLNSTFLSWLGTQVEITRTQVVIRRTGSSIKVDLEAASLHISQNLFNFEGVVNGKTASLIRLSRNTVNRTQFYLTTDGTTQYAFVNNRFAFPPSQNRFSLGGASRYPVRILGDFNRTGSSATGNVRDTSWSGFELPTLDTLFTDASNVLDSGIAGKADTTLWDWRIAGETEVGAWSGPAAQALPPHNIFPGQTSLAPPELPTTLRPTFNFATANIPRYVPVTLATSISYPIHDSLRTLFIKDTAFSIAAPADSAYFFLQSLILPNALGTPRLLGAPSGSTFTLGPAGAENATTFASPSPSSRILIPVFGGQNTWKGTQVVVARLGTDTSITFETVTRTGRTQLLSARRVDSTVLQSQVWKRYRPLLRNSTPVGLGLTTNAALGLDSMVTLAIPRAGSTAPFATDAVYAYDGNDFHKVMVDNTHYRVTLPINRRELGLAVAFFEKLTLGRGSDTLTLEQGHRILSESTAGYQFTMESSTTTEPSRMPYFDGTLRLFKPGWTGRVFGNILEFEMKRASPDQAAYVYIARSGAETDTWELRDPERSDSGTLTLTLNMDDNTKSFFVGRKYSLPGNNYFEWSDENHRIPKMASSKPGELRVDTTLDAAASLALNALLGDTLQVLKKKQLITENLIVTEDFEMHVRKTDSVARESLRVYVWKQDTLVGLSAQDVKLDSGFWRFPMKKEDRIFVLLRRLPPIDTTGPVTDTTKKEPKLTRLRLSPRIEFLTELNEEKPFTWAYTPDSVTAQMQQGKVRFQLSLWPDTSAIPATVSWKDTLPNLARVDTLGRVTRLMPESEAPAITLALRMVSVADSTIADTVYVKLISKSTRDTLTIKPSADPVIKTVEGRTDQVKIVPSLDEVNASKLKEIRIQQISLAPNGKVRRIDTVIPADTVPKGIFLTVGEGMITTFKVSYVSQGGKETPDTTALSTLSTAGFAAAVNALAPDLSTKRRELIGSPFAMRLGDLFPALGSGSLTPAPEIDAYKDATWKRLNQDSKNPTLPPIADVFLERGKGYLLYLPKASKPRIQASDSASLRLDSLLAPVTLDLVKGWQIISNPKPFAFADADIELTDSLVSYFSKLEWPEDSQQEKWSVVDTLQPFRGYAVFAKAATRIVFNPKVSMQATAKKATARLVNLHLQASWGASATLILTDAKVTRAFTQQGFSPRLKSAWKKNQGLVLSAGMQNGLAETFQVTSAQRGKVRLALSASGGVQDAQELYVWSPASGRLVSLSEHPEFDMAPGTQEFQLLKLASSAREGEERRLRSLYPTGFTYRIDMRRGKLAAAVPAGAGSENSLGILLFDLKGRIGHQSLYRNLQPGWHELSLPKLEQAHLSGQAFLRVQWRDAQGQQSKLFPVGVQP